MTKGRFFEHPSNRHRERVDHSSSILVLLCGGLYLLFKGLWGHALIWVICVGGFAVTAGEGVGMILSAPTGGFVYAMVIQKILASRYLRNGWKELI